MQGSILPQTDIIETANFFERQPDGDIETPAGVFAIIWVAKGLANATLRIGGVKSPIHIAGGFREGLLLLMPPESTLKANWVPELCEAVVAKFKCDALSYDKKSGLAVIALDGDTQELDIKRMLPARNNSAIRSGAESVLFLTSENMKKGTYLRATIGLWDMLAHLFIMQHEARAIHSLANIERLMKDIEAGDINTKIGELESGTKYSSVHIRNAFKERTGKTPHQHLAEHILGKATHLICHTDMKFKDISDKLGFFSQTYFTFFVRKHTGKTPRALRYAVLGKQLKRK